MTRDAAGDIARDAAGHAESASPAHAIGRREDRDDVVGPLVFRGFAALLEGLPEAAGSGHLRPDTVRLDIGLPPLWHWGLFQDWVTAASLGRDGHPHRGGFLPATGGLGSRMFAGGRLRFHRPLRLGEAVRRRSVIRRVKETDGRTGRLVIVTVEHEVGGEAGPAITEEQDLVFRAPVPLAAKPPEPPPDAPSDAWRRVVTPDSVTLFRMSALTGNGHRIHYDQPYAIAVEGYPSLVVHGPLQAMWLADLAQRHMPTAMRLSGFAFRGQRPAFVDRPLTLEGWIEAGVARLRSCDDSGAVCMTAEASFAPEA